MKYVENEIFYHLQNPKIKGLEIGKTYTIGEDFNPHYLGYYNFAIQPKLVQTKQELNDIIHNYHQLFIEDIFEKVRQQNFPKEPSRQKGLWLIPDNVYMLSYWQTQLGNQRELVKLSCTGKISQLDSKFISFPIYGGRKIHEGLAYRYWNGEQYNQDIKTLEFLFVGNVNILDIYR